MSRVVRLVALGLLFGAGALPGMASQAAARAPTRVRTVQVFAAASLSDAFSDIARDYQRAHPGTRVELNLAGSQQLAAQIEQGAAADVFACADDRWMDYLLQRGLVNGTPQVFAHNR